MLTEPAVMTLYKLELAKIVYSLNNIEWRVPASKLASKL